ncbi:MAG: hypothetical protein EPO58_14095 [Chitinophagaceae bacterium]|nr:MAG: hypothetical protein EPO58_14095 [Chitinophagaceae bacterium]
MKRFPINTELTEAQKNIILTFILKFLPKRGNKRKHSGNELEYVANVIDRIIKQQFGFSLTRKNVLKCFEELQYDIFTRNGDWNSEEKKWVPSKKGDIVRMGDAFSDYNAAFIYIDIDATIVRDLKLATFTLPPNASEEKRLDKTKLDEQIKLFKQSHPYRD